MWQRAARRRLRRAEQGFTLVEIFVVVGIITVLLTMAIPTMLAYRGRASRAEAKSALAAIRTQMETYFASHDTYVDNLQILGYTPDGDPRYLYGFTSDSLPAPSGRNDSAEIIGTFGRANMVAANGLPLSESDLPTAVATRTTFTIGAVGNIDLDAGLDRLTLSKDGGLQLVVDDITAN